VARKEPHITFSAYTDTDELPVGRSGGAARPRHRMIHRRRLRIWVLSLVLISVSGVAVHQYAEPLRGQLEGVMSLRLAEIQRPRMPALDGPLFNRPIRTVRIESVVRRISESDIRSVLARHIDDGFFRIDVRQVKQELEANPWVDQASIRRVWPDTLSVSVTEQQPIARWGNSELINPYAERFVPPDIEGVELLPVLRGPVDGEETMMRQYQQFSQMLQNSGLRIRELSLSDRGSWSMETDNGIRLEIGREKLTERMQRFVVLYDRALHGKADEISVIDLRYRNGLAVRSRETGTGEVASL